MSKHVGFGKIISQQLMVGCADHPPLVEPKAELDVLMTDETVSNVPILTLGNKIDRSDAISEEKLRETFGL